MDDLNEFVFKYTVRGSCTCGRCADAPETPTQPSGHTADMIFFKVAAVNNPSAEELRALIQSRIKGDFTDVDMFDGKEHSYLEVGAWIGSQDSALRLMGLGSLLGLWTLMTPVTMLGLTSSDRLALDMAGMGYVAVRAA